MLIKPNVSLGTCVIPLQNERKCTRTEAVEARIEGKGRLALFVGFVEKSGRPQDVTHRVVPYGHVGMPPQKVCGLIVGAIQVALLDANVGGDGGPVWIELGLTLVRLQRLGHCRLAPFP